MADDAYLEQLSFQCLINKYHTHTIQRKNYRDIIGLTDVLNARNRGIANVLVTHTYTYTHTDIGVLKNGVECTATVDFFKAIVKTRTVVEKIIIFLNIENK